MKLVLSLSAAIVGCLIIITNTFFNKAPAFVTSDIGHFWEAMDSLKYARSTQDSTDIIQAIYLDRMSSEGEKFIEIRKYTAPEYLRTIRKYPVYLKQLRLKTRNMAVYQANLDSTFAKLKKAIPDYEVPRICFAVGCFRGGGTTKKDLILMGSEIALADSLMDFSEFKGNLRAVLSQGINLDELVAHESIHCQQHHARNRSLLSIALQEGTADFLPALILNPGKLPALTPYKLAHECELWQEFKANADGDDLSQWLFNTGSIKNRPPDLGYFVGMRICQAYYNNQPNKQTAIKTLLDRSKYKQVMQLSNYNGNCK